jgi:hypothetical protein
LLEGQSVERPEGMLSRHLAIRGAGWQDVEPSEYQGTRRGSKGNGAGEGGDPTRPSLPVVLALLFNRSERVVDLRGRELARRSERDDASPAVERRPEVIEKPVTTQEGDVLGPGGKPDAG